MASAHQREVTYIHVTVYTSAVDYIYKEGGREGRRESGEGEGERDSEGGQRYERERMSNFSPSLQATAWIGTVILDVLAVIYFILLCSYCRRRCLSDTDDQQFTPLVMTTFAETEV